MMTFSNASSAAGLSKRLRVLSLLGGAALMLAATVPSQASITPSDVDAWQHIVDCAAALFSIVFVPVAAHLAGLVVGRPIDVSPLTVARIVATSILLPLVAGVVVGRLKPALAARLAAPLSAAGTIVLLLAFIPVLFGEWHAIVALFGDFTLVAIVVFVAVGLAIGHALGGPDPGDHGGSEAEQPAAPPGPGTAAPGRHLGAGQAVPHLDQHRGVKDVEPLEV